MFGVGSGMPLRTAVRKAPDAVFLPVDAALYTEASEGVMAVLRSFGPTDGAVVEVLGWDEAFVGVTTDDAEGLARRIQAAVLEQTRLHCSIGIGQTKVMAKTATGFGKPQGVYTITADTWYEIMGPRPTDALWGVGRKTAAKLAELGIETVSQLALAEAEPLVARLGPDDGAVVPPHRAGRGPVGRDGDSLGRSRPRPRATFQTNLRDWTVVAQEVRTLAARVLDDIVAEGRPAVRVGLKVRYAPFTTHTASAPLPSPPSTSETIADAAVALLSRFDERRSVRLLGVRLEMEPPPGGYPRSTPPGAAGRLGVRGCGGARRLEADRREQHLGDVDDLDVLARRALGLLRR